MLQNQTKQDIFAFWQIFQFFFYKQYSLSTKQNRELYAILLGYKEKTRLNSASKHTLPSPQYGQYLTHAYSHITRAVAAMDSCFAIIRLHQHTVELVMCAYWPYLLFLYKKKAFNWRVLTSHFLGPRSRIFSPQFNSFGT